MEGSREQKMQDLLKRLKEESPGVEAVVLISSDAMPLSSELPEAADEQTLCALASSLLASGERVASDLTRGDVEHIYLRGENGDLLVMKVNDNAMLACAVDHQAKMGMVLLDAGRCAEKLGEVI